MDCIITLFGRDFSKEEFRAYLEKKGAYSPREKFSYDAVISRRKANVYVDLDENLRDYDSTELSEIARTMKEDPVVAVIIHIGHAKDSRNLALELANDLLEKWGGYLDDNV